MVRQLRLGPRRLLWATLLSLSVMVTGLANSNDPFEAELIQQYNGAITDCEAAQSPQEVSSDAASEVAAICACLKTKFSADTTLTSEIKTAMVAKLNAYAADPTLTSVAQLRGRASDFFGFNASSSTETTLTTSGCSPICQEGQLCLEPVSELVSASDARLYGQLCTADRDCDPNGSGQFFCLNSICHLKPKCIDPIALGAQCNPFYADRALCASGSKCRGPSFTMVDARSVLWFVSFGGPMNYTAQSGGGYAVTKQVSGCYSLGKQCLSDAQCCSTSCVPPAQGGAKVCTLPAQINSCKAMGESCQQNSECCENFCHQSRCDVDYKCLQCLEVGMPVRSGVECCPGLSPQNVGGKKRCLPSITTSAILKKFWQALIGISDVQAATAVPDHCKLDNLHLSYLSQFDLFFHGLNFIFNSPTGKDGYSQFPYQLSSPVIPVNPERPYSNLQSELRLLGQQYETNVYSILRDLKATTEFQTLMSECTGLIETKEYQGSSIRLYRKILALLRQKRLEQLRALVQLKPKVDALYESMASYQEDTYWNFKTYVVDENDFSSELKVAARTARDLYYTKREFSGGKNYPAPIGEFKNGSNYPDQQYSWGDNQERSGWIDVAILFGGIALTVVTAGASLVIAIVLVTLGQLNSGPLALSIPEDRSQAYSEGMYLWRTAAEKLGEEQQVDCWTWSGRYSRGFLGLNFGRYAGYRCFKNFVVPNPICKFAVPTTLCINQVYKTTNGLYLADPVFSTYVPASALTLEAPSRTYAERVEGFLLAQSFGKSSSSEFNLQESSQLQTLLTPTQTRNLLLSGESARASSCERRLSGVMRPQEISNKAQLHMNCRMIPDVGAKSLFLPITSDYESKFKEAAKEYAKTQALFWQNNEEHLANFASYLYQMHFLFPFSGDSARFPQQGMIYYLAFLKEMLGSIDEQTLTNDSIYRALSEHEQTLTAHEYAASGAKMEETGDLPQSIDLSKVEIVGPVAVQATLNSQYSSFESSPSVNSDGVAPTVQGESAQGKTAVSRTSSASGALTRKGALTTDPSAKTSDSTTASSLSATALQSGQAITGAGQTSEEMQMLAVRRNLFDSLAGRNHFEANDGIAFDDSFYGLQVAVEESSGAAAQNQERTGTNAPQGQEGTGATHRKESSTPGSDSSTSSPQASDDPFGLRALMGKVGGIFGLSGSAEIKTESATDLNPLVPAPVHSRRGEAAAGVGVGLAADGEEASGKSGRSIASDSTMTLFDHVTKAYLRNLDRLLTK